jgi:hypothetical protein
LSGDPFIGSTVQVEGLRKLRKTMETTYEILLQRKDGVTEYLLDETGVPQEFETLQEAKMRAEERIERDDEISDVFVRMKSTVLALSGKSKGPLESVMGQEIHTSEGVETTILLPPFVHDPPVLSAESLKQKV